MTQKLDIMDDKGEIQSEVIRKIYDGVVENMDELIDKCAENKGNAYDTAINFLKCCYALRKTEYL